MRRVRGDQRGFTIIELLVSMGATMVVLVGVVTLTTLVIHNSARITSRTDIDSRVRPAMTHIVQGLHSSCVTSHITPIRRDALGNASSGTSISFLSKPGSAPGPTPDLHTISLNGSTLSESVYRANGTSPPDWGGFTTKISGPYTLLTNVTAPGGVIFRYYDFVNGALNTTPLATPLSDTNAARVSYVTVSFTAASSSTINGGVNSQDPNSPLMTTSGVDLRLENAGQYPNQDNLPCV
jgi:Tfp pilus assembly protein PilW